MTTSRLNAKLEAHGLQPMNSLVTDLSDGVKLIQLMVSAIGDTFCPYPLVGNHGFVFTTATFMLDV